MTRQTWTAVVAALCFAACALVAALVPVPFVVWAPGTTRDLLATGDGAPVAVSGNAPTFPTSGRLLLTTLSQTRTDGTVSLVEALYSYWADDREVLPRSAVYPAGARAEVVTADEAVALAASEQDAKAAALRSAGVKVVPVPVVEAVNAAGPAVGKLSVGDVVTAIQNATTGVPANVQTAADAAAAIASVKVGDKIVFSVLRGGVKQDIVVTTQGSKSNPDQPVAGVTFAQGYRYDSTISFELDKVGVGGDGGLMMALAVYDKVTPDALLKDRVVAGSGTIDANGAVGRVPGIRERIATAERAGASVFLLPSANCADVATLQPTVRLVPVATLTEAVGALTAIADPSTEKSVKGCS